MLELNPNIVQYQYVLRLRDYFVTKGLLLCHGIQAKVGLLENIAVCAETKHTRGLGYLVIDEGCKQQVLKSEILNIAQAKCSELQDLQIDKVLHPCHQFGTISAAETEGLTTDAEKSNLSGVNGGR